MPRSVLRSTWTSAGVTKPSAYSARFEREQQAREQTPDDPPTPPDDTGHVPDEAAPLPEENPVEDATPAG